MVRGGDRQQDLYFASQAAGAYGEIVAQFRPSLKLLAGLPAAPVAVGQRQAPLIPRDWRAARRLGVTVLAPPLLFVVVEDVETVQALRPALAPLAVALGLPDVDLSAITGPQRRLTQELALHVYNQVDPRGAPLYADGALIVRDAWAGRPPPATHDRSGAPGRKRRGCGCTVCAPDGRPAACACHPGCHRRGGLGRPRCVRHPQ